MDEVTAVVISIGNGFVKAGFAGDDVPKAGTVTEIFGLLRLPQLRGSISKFASRFLILSDRKEYREGLG